MLIMATGGAGEGTSGSGAGPTPGNDPEQYDNPNYGPGMLPEEYSKLYPCC